MSYRKILVSLSLAFVLGAGAGFATRALEGEIELTDVAEQTRQFIEYERSIRLTPAQEGIKRRALTAIAAPCCSDNTAYTCCCPCNMSRSIWGLSNYLIAEQDAGVDEVRAAVEEWIELINPDGFSGDVCYTAGGCSRPFADNGCGGMSPKHLVLD